jgi:Tol biopolymer transport system component
LAGFLALAPRASALSLQRPFKETFGSAAQPIFGDLTAIAVERRTGDVLVADEFTDTLSRFHADGTPAPFTALGTNVIDGAEANGEPCPEEPASCDETPQGGIEVQRTEEMQIAVDESGGPTDGDIYLTQPQIEVNGERTGLVDIFAADGHYLGQLTQAGQRTLPIGEVKGVAVDSSGAVYLVDGERSVSKFVPRANPATNDDFTATFEPEDSIGKGEIFKHVAVGSGPTEGSIFVTIQGSNNEGRFEHVRQLDKETGRLELEFGENVLGVVAVDPVTHNILTGDGSEYEAPGGSQPVKVARLRSNVGIRTLAINGSSEVLVVGSFTSNEPMSIYGPPAVVPTVAAEPVSEVSGTKATLTGTVDPDGLPVTKCVFEVFGGPEPEREVACEGSIPTDSSPHPVHVTISGLQPNGRTYQFRIVAFNANGQEESVTSFTTAHTVVTEPPAVVGPTTATLSGLVRPEGNEYSECFFEYGLTTNTSFEKKVPCNPGASAISADFSPHEVRAAITGLQSGADYRYKLVATNESLGTLEGDQVTFGTLGVPRIEEVQASGADQSSVTLEAKINPSGFGTSYRFEWGSTTAYGHVAPVEFEPFLGAGTGPIPVKTRLSGLAPGSAYHYRVVATSAQGATVSPDHVAETLNSCGLPDGRCFEEVSRSEAGPVAIPGEANSAIDMHFQAATAGPGGLAYPVESGYPEASEGSNVLYRGLRSPGGWESAQVSPPILASNERTDSVSVSSSTEFLSNDLSCGFTESNQPLTADAGMRLAREEGESNLYRNNPDGSYTGVTTLPPEGIQNKHGLPIYNIAGASQDCGMVLFATALSYSGVPTTALGDGERLYEWRGGILRNAGVVPGPSGRVIVSAAAGSEGDTQNTVSEDGSRIFFTAERQTSPDPAEIGAKAIFVREDGGEEDGGATRDVSLSQTATPDTGAQYQWATADGSRVFFTANAGLTASSNSEGTDLYEYDLGTKQLTDRSVTRAAGGAEVVGFVGASADGSRVYFASRNQLVPGSGNSQAQNVTADSYSIYSEKADEISFVGTVGGEDLNTVVIKSATFQTAQVSPDGRYLLFESSSRVTGYASAGLPEVYLYDSQAGSAGVTCVSCRQDGQPSPDDRYGDPGYALLSRGLGVQNLLHAPHFLTMHNGEPEVFFASPDPLASGAVAGQNNVYEWSHDQVFRLASAAEGSQDVPKPNKFALFGGASDDGSDVYLVTPETLTWEDGDGRLSVYDARVGGGFPEPSAPPPPCDATAEGSCLGSSTSTPSVFGPPASATLSGAGNLVAPAPVVAKPVASKPLTRAQKLAQALRACHKYKSKSKRLSCEKQARKNYGAKPKPKPKAKAKAKAHKGGK